MWYRGRNYCSPCTQGLQECVRQEVVVLSLRRRSLGRICWKKFPIDEAGRSSRIRRKENVGNCEEANTMLMLDGKEYHATSKKQRKCRQPRERKPVALVSVDDKNPGQGLAIHRQIDLRFTRTDVTKTELD